jgi:hypothetical protein
MDEPFDFEAAFLSISAAMGEAAKATHSRDASAEAERWGLKEQPCRPFTTSREWRRSEGSRMLVFRFRFYDQSRPFSIRPDMNILSLELTENGAMLRTAEERYED